MRLWEYESSRVREYESTRYETMRLWDYDTMKLRDYDNDMMSGAGLRPAIDGVREYDMVRLWEFETRRLDDYTTIRRWYYEYYESLRLWNETMRLWHDEVMKLWLQHILRHELESVHIYNRKRCLKHLLVLLERIWSSVGASLRALEASLGALGWVLGALRKGGLVGAL